MKTFRLLVSLAFALVLFSCGGTKDATYRMDYAVAVDTASHYLLVTWTCKWLPVPVK